MENTEDDKTYDPNFRNGMFQKGGKPGPGRPKGSVNRSAKELREAYQNLVDNNIDNMTHWLAEIAAESPEKAMDMMLKLSEYVLPKMSRQEITGKDGEDLFTNIRFDFGLDAGSENARLIDTDEDTPRIDS
jgi:hypothetical protein